MEVDEWYFLGVVLKVPVSKLKEIQGSSPQAGIRFWRIDVLYHWLQSTPHASWNDIVSALKKIGQHTLSARLQEKYITPYTACTGMSCSTNAIVWMYSMSYCNTDCIVPGAHKRKERSAAIYPNVNSAVRCTRRVSDDVYYQQSKESDIGSHLDRLHGGH